MNYKINCGLCGEEISVSAEDDMDGMEKLKEEAEVHNNTLHPEESRMTDEELETDIKSKWEMEE